MWYGNYTSQKPDKLINKDVAVDLTLRALLEVTFFEKLGGDTPNGFISIFNSHLFR